MFFGVERGHQLSTQATGVGIGGHPKCVQVRIGGGGVTPHVYVRTYLFSYFLSALLHYSVKKMCSSETVFFSPIRSISVVMK